MVTRTIDTEHGDGPNITMTTAGGGTFQVVFDDEDDPYPVKIYRNGELRWEGDEQDLYMEVVYEGDEDGWGYLGGMGDE